MPGIFTHPSTWKRRQRNKGRRDVVSGLHQTHAFVEADNPIVTGDSFPDRDRDLTVAVDIRISAAAINGIVFELGGGTAGFSLVVASNFAAIYAGETGDDGVVAIANNVPNVAGQLVRIVAATRPGTGEVWLWINGKLSARATSVNGAFSNGWATSLDGAVGETANTVHPDVPGPQAVALANAQVVGPARIYNGFLPKNLTS